MDDQEVTGTRLCRQNHTESITPYERTPYTMLIHSAKADTDKIMPIWSAAVTGCRSWRKLSALGRTGASGAMYPIDFLARLTFPESTQSGHAGKSRPA